WVKPIKSKDEQHLLPLLQRRPALHPSAAPSRPAAADPASTHHEPMLRSSGIPQPNPSPWSPPHLRPAPPGVRPQQPGEETDLPFPEHHHMARIRPASISPIFIVRFFHRASNHLSTQRCSWPACAASHLIQASFLPSSTHRLQPEISHHKSPPNRILVRSNTHSASMVTIPSSRRTSIRSAPSDHSKIHRAASMQITQIQARSIHGTQSNDQHPVFPPTLAARPIQTHTSKSRSTTVIAIRARPAGQFQTDDGKSIFYTYGFHRIEGYK
ncbi:hypothetical protein ACLOJK_006935, partial [Asimina triloba]